MDSIDFFSKRADAAKPDNKQNQYRRQSRRPADQGPRVLLCRLRGTRITRGVTRITSVPTADRARRHLHDGHQGSDHRPELRQQHDSGQPDRSVCRLDHRAGAAAQSAGRQQFLPHRQPDRQLRSAADSAATGGHARRTASSAATSIRRAIATSRRVRRRHRRHRHVRVRQSDDQDQRVRRRLDPGVVGDDGQRGARLVVAVGLGRRAPGLRADAAGQRADSRHDHQSDWSPADSRASPSTASSAAPASAVSARRTSCRSSSTPISSSISTRCRGCAATTRSSSAPTSLRR